VYQIFPDEVLGSGQFGVVYGGKDALSGPRGWVEPWWCHTSLSDWPQSELASFDWLKLDRGYRWLVAGSSFFIGKTNEIRGLSLCFY
jgi:hypothetical protein